VALKDRFDPNQARLLGLVWAKVSARLEVRPEKLWPLAEKDRTDGVKLGWKLVLWVRPVR